jgi:hypothetical protein
MLSGDLALVGPNEMSVADNLLTADEEPIDPVGC